MTTRIIRVSMFSHFRNQGSVNVLHYHANSTIGSPTPVEQVMAFVNSAAKTNIETAFKEALAQPAIYEGMKVRTLDPVNKLLDQEVTSTVNSGNGTADTAGILPSQVAGLIAKRTDIASRAGRGRFYMPFVPGGADNEADDLLTAAYTTVLTDLAEVLILTINATFAGSTNTFKPGILTGRDINTFKPWLSFRVRAGFATQRRRSFFGRPNAELSS